MYEEGLIAPGAIDDLMRHIPSRYEEPARLLREHADIFSPALQKRLKQYRQRRDDQQRLLRFANKVEIPKGGVFRFREKEYRSAEAAKLLPKLEEEIKSDRGYLTTLDKRIFLIYMGMARQLHQQTGQELEGRYRFHVAIQEMFACLVYWDRQLQMGFQALAEKRDPDPNVVRGVGAILNEAHNALNHQLAEANTLRLPPSKNTKAG